MSPENVDRFRAGEEIMIAALVAEHSPRLLGTALRLTGDRARAHDLVHEAWVRAYERRETYGQTGSFIGWMLAILQSCRHRDHRVDARHLARADAFAREAETAHDPSDLLAATLDRPIVHRQLLDGLAQLTERQRTVISMRIIEGRSVADTATTLGVAEGTIKATLFQALQRMRSIVPEIHP